jgi:plastocyanin
MRNNGLAGGAAGARPYQPIRVPRPWRFDVSRTAPTSRIPVIIVLATLLVAALAASAVAKGSSVKVGDNFFKPKSLHITRNATVKWKWTGKSPHNVTVTSGPVRFMSPTKKHGSYSHKFTKKGTYSIVCTIHSNMVMSVVVR